jgi:hypothetical protein
VADKDFIFNGNALTDKGVALNLAALTDKGVFLDFDEGTDPGAIVYFAAIEVDKVVENDIFAEFHIRCYLFHFGLTAEAQSSPSKQYFSFAAERAANENLLPLHGKYDSCKLSNNAQTGFINIIGEMLFSPFCPLSRKGKE